MSRRPSSNLGRGRRSPDRWRWNERFRGIGHCVTEHSCAVAACEGAGLAIVVVAAVSDHLHLVDVAAAAMIGSPAALGAGVHHAGVGNVGRAVIGLNAGGDGGGKDEEGEQSFHGDGFQVLNFSVSRFPQRECCVHEGNRRAWEFDCGKMKFFPAFPSPRDRCGSSEENAALLCRRSAGDLPVR
jgi:hypothetical protein